MIIPKGTDTEMTFMFFEKALFFIQNSDYKKEMNYQNDLIYEKLELSQFFNEFVFVVLSAGMKNQIVTNMFKKFIDSKYDPGTVGHELKRAAIIKGLNNQEQWFVTLKSKKTDRERVEYLGTLPFIGKITKYHLAKNLGIDCVKPDRHLVLLAKKFKWDSPRIMCDWLKEKFILKLRVIDVILWRYLNLHPDIIKQFKQDLLQ